MGKVVPIQLSPAAFRFGLTPSSQEAAYHYTIDLLMEDFGKKHFSSRCVLCEPMRTLGKHRDEVIRDLHHSLFTMFFPDFEDYLLEIRESLVQKLLRRDQEVFPSWKEKLVSQLKSQIRRDAWGLLEDIFKHLKKYCGVTYEPLKQEDFLNRLIQHIFQQWVPDKFRH